MRPLWLASSSPRRKKMLLEAGLAPRLDPGSLDDDLLRFNRASVPSICLARAWFKALGSHQRLLESESPDPGDRGVLLAADTLCELAGAPLGKPRNEADALEMLHSLCGARHRTITAVALLDRATMDRSLWFDAAEVTIGTVPETELRRYVATDGWRGKSGGYNLEDRISDGWPVTCDGDPATVMGLPVRRLVPEVVQLLDRSQST